MTLRADRNLPNRYVRQFMLATQAETGDYSLRLMLRNAGLDRFLTELPPDNQQAIVLASEFAALQAAMRQYFGNGARGSLIRIGRIHWQSIQAAAPLIQKVKLTAGRQMPNLQAGKIVLNFLAATLRGIDGDISAHLLDKELIFMDTSSDATIDQSSDLPICWATLGMIHAALAWVTRKEQSVEEISCCSTGAAACRFRIQIMK
jgi:predicted hydrocarbon binding protein